MNELGSKKDTVKIKQVAALKKGCVDEAMRVICRLILKNSTYLRFNLEASPRRRSAPLAVHSVRDSKSTVSLPPIPILIIGHQASPTTNSMRWQSNGAVARIACNCHQDRQ